MGALTGESGDRRGAVGYTAHMPQLAPGSQIAGYRIDSLLGRGGMGVVYRAFQIGLERVVAAPGLPKPPALRVRGEVELLG